MTDDDPDHTEPASGDEPGACFCPHCEKDVEPSERLRWVAKLDRVALCRLCPSCDNVLQVTA